jgi:hypothetical protein
MLDDMEFDTYTIVLDLPTGDVTETIYLEPNTNQTVYLSPHTLEFTVTNASGGAVLADAIIDIAKTDVGYTASEPTAIDGQHTFTSLRTGQHDFTVTLDGFAQMTGTFDVLPGDNVVAVSLTPDP